MSTDPSSPPADAAFAPADTPVRVLPTVSIGRSATTLPADVAARIISVTVDSGLHLPDMFEILFEDGGGDVVTRAGIQIGTRLQVSASAAASGRLIDGEVTAIEGTFDELRRIAVRGYSAEHRLQRRRTSRTFLNMTDSDIASKVARDAGLTVGTVKATRTAHDHIAQVNQSDWDFLRARATRIGYEFGISDGTFFFRPASGVDGGTVVDLPFPKRLRRFQPRLTAGNLAGSAEARVWDPVNGKAATAVTATTSRSASVQGTTPASLADTFAPTAAARRAPTGTPGRDTGPAPSADAHVVDGWALGGAAQGSARDEAAAGIAEHLGSTFAEAEGEAVGDPRLAAGTAVKVSGVGNTFSGTWTITRAVHVFERSGYRTRFEVSGRQDRSLLGLATGGPEGAVTIPGLVGGLVSNIADPQKLGRVKVTLPWLSPTFESDWAGVAQAGVGARSGALFSPEVDDAVLVGFEFGDPHRPYVVGSLMTDRSTMSLGGEPVKRSGNAASVAWRGMVTPTGNRLAFHDELPAGAAGGTPLASDLVLGTGAGNMALVVDQKAGTVELKCEPKPPGSSSTKGTLSIVCGPAGTINLTCGAGGTVTIDGGAQLSLKASASISVESQGPLTLKGNPIKLN